MHHQINHMSYFKFDCGEFRYSLFWFAFPCLGEIAENDAKSQSGFGLVFSIFNLDFFSQLYKYSPNFLTDI